MELIHEFDYRATLDAPLQVGAGPFGARTIFPVSGGTATGERISGTLVGGGADWALLGADGMARLDVRGHIQTDDGAVIYLSYHGYLELNEKVGAALAGGGDGTDFGDQYFRTAPRLETGDERYAWVNRTLFVGEGRVLPDPGVEYRVYRVG